LISVASAHAVICTVNVICMSDMVFTPDLSPCCRESSQPHSNQTQLSDGIVISVSWVYLLTSDNILMKGLQHQDKGLSHVRTWTWQISTDSFSSYSSSLASNLFNFSSFLYELTTPCST
jgi:hypothetical protein